MLRLALRVRRDAAEIVLARLLELVPAGLEEVDVDADSVEFVLYGDAAELPPERELERAAAGAFVALSASEIADDWAESWRRFHKPLVLGTRLCVRPPWEPAVGTELELVIDPGRAFGTGAHATTRLCLELMLGLEPLGLEPGPGGTVDLGCGSGVLAIAAVKLGLGPVVALDFDPLAVAATLENAAINGVGDAIEVRRFDLTQEPVPAAGLVLANLLAPLLSAWAERLAGAGARARPAAIIASGVLVTEADAVCAAFAAAGFQEVRRLTLGEWSAIAMRGADSL